MLFPSRIDAVVLLGNFRSALPSFFRVTLSWTSDLPAFTPVSSSFGAGCPLLNAIIGSAERLLLSAVAMAILVGAFMAGLSGKPPSKPAVCIGGALGGGAIIFGIEVGGGAGIDVILVSAKFAIG